MAMAPLQQATADAFFGRFPVSQGFSKMAQTAFEALLPQEKYKAVQILRQDPIGNRPYISRLFSLPQEIRKLSPLEGMIRLIGDTEAQVGSHHVKNRDDLWGRRFKTARMLCQLESWQMALQRQAVNDPSDTTFEGTHRELLEELKGYYEWTNPQDLGNPLFDTDGDGSFDDEDKFQLDKRFSRDENGDSMPDELAEGDAWQGALGEGEEKRLALPDGRTLLAVLRTAEGYKLKIHVRFMFESEEAKQEHERLWPEARVRVSRFINERAPNGVRVEIVDDKRAANTILIRDRALAGGDDRENKGEWFSDTLTKGRTAALAHEVMHLVGAADTYQEDFFHSRDHVFGPGWGVLADKDGMMACDTQTARVEPVELLSPLGIVIYQSGNPDLANGLRVAGAGIERVGANLVRGPEEKWETDFRVMRLCQIAEEIDPADGRLFAEMAAANLQSARGIWLPHIQDYTQKALEAASEAVLFEPSSAHAWALRGLALLGLSQLEPDDIRQDLLSRAIYSFKRALTITPTYVPYWENYALACEQMALIPGLDGNRYPEIARRARKRAKALTPSATATVQSRR